MKECKYCGSQYNDNFEFCPNCGASATVTAAEKAMPERKYEEEKVRFERGRKNKLALTTGIALVVVVGIVVAAVFLFDDGSRSVMSATGMSKGEIKSVYAAGEAYMEQGDYANASLEFQKISGYKDADALSGEAVEKYRDEILMQAQVYMTQGRYSDAMSLLNTAADTVGTDAAFEAQTNDIKEAYAMDLIAQADSKSASGDFTGALELLQTAGNLGIQSAELTTKITEVNSAYKQRFFEEVDRLTGEKNFTQALATLQTIEDVFGSAPETSQKITATHKAKVLDKLAEYDASIDYAGAIGYINSEIANINNDTEIIAKLNTYKAEYKSGIMKQAEELFENAAIEGAVTLLESSYGILDNDVEITEVITEYKSYLPVDLFTLHLIQEDLDSGHGIQKTSSARDNYGNEYSDAYIITPDKFHWASQTYMLNGEYGKVYGTIAVLDSSKDSNNQQWIEFYNGDEYIGASGILTAGVAPESFSFDIENVNTLKLYYCVMGGDYKKQMITNGIFVSK